MYGPNLGPSFSPFDGVQHFRRHDSGSPPLDPVRHTGTPPTLRPSVTLLFHYTPLLGQGVGPSQNLLPHRTDRPRNQLLRPTSPPSSTRPSPGLPSLSPIYDHPRYHKGQTVDVSSSPSVSPETTLSRYLSTQGDEGL